MNAQETLQQWVDVQLGRGLWVIALRVHVLAQYTDQCVSCVSHSCGSAYIVRLCIHATLDHTQGNVRLYIGLCTSSSMQYKAVVKHDYMNTHQLNVMYVEYLTAWPITTKNVYLTFNQIVYELHK